MPSRWRDLLCCITKEQEYLKSFGEEKKIALLPPAVQCIYYSIFFNLSNRKLLWLHQNDKPAAERSLADNMKPEGKVHRSFPGTKSPRLSLCLHLSGLPT